ncbi:hypothetical protein GVX76_05115 [[Haemophilus] felis]|nr:hypothetical protein [[Haemophilus] felis]
MKQLFDIDTLADKFLKKLNFQKPYRFFYRGLLPKFIRSPVEQKFNLRKQQNIAQAWRTMLESYFAKELDDFILRPKKTT